MWNDQIDFFALDRLGPSKVTAMTRTRMVLVAVALIVIPGVGIWLMLANS